MMDLCLYMLMTQRFVFLTPVLSPCRHLESTLEGVVRWFMTNKLSANLRKTKLMFFGTPSTLKNMNEFTVSLAGETVENVDPFKYLGVKLDSLLSFNEHVNYIKGKTFSKIKLLER